MKSYTPYPRSVANSIQVHRRELVSQETMQVIEQSPQPRQRVDVHTRDLANLDEPPTHRRIDWTHEGREWLMHHMTFAMRTGKSVTLAPVGE